MVSFNWWWIVEISHDGVLSLVSWKETFWHHQPTFAVLLKLKMLMSDEEQSITWNKRESVATSQAIWVCCTSNWKKNNSCNTLTQKHGKERIAYAGCCLLPTRTCALLIKLLRKLCIQHILGGRKNSFLVAARALIAHCCGDRATILASGSWNSFLPGTISGAKPASIKEYCDSVTIFYNLITEKLLHN